MQNSNEALKTARSHSLKLLNAPTISQKVAKYLICAKSPPTVRTAYVLSCPGQEKISPMSESFTNISCISKFNVFVSKQEIKPARNIVVI